MHVHSVHDTRITACGSLEVTGCSTSVWTPPALKEPLFTTPEVHLTICGVSWCSVTMGSEPEHVRKVLSTPGRGPCQEGSDGARLMCTLPPALWSDPRETCLGSGSGN